MKNDARISECKKYRYWLTRSIDAAYCTLQPALFIMLNPSTADALKDDPTIRRCIGFARGWKCSGIVIVNLFAYRTPYPKILRATADPVGPENDEYLRTFLTQFETVVCAWGINATMDRVKEIKKMAKACGTTLQCLGPTTIGNYPRHPLMLKASTPLRHYL